MTDSTRITINSIGILLVAIGVCLLATSKRPSPTDPDVLDSHTDASTRAPHLDALWSAICMVESNNNPNAVGDDGLAIGIAQIQPIMVRDVNRIIGCDRFTLDSCLSPRESREIFNVFATHYGAGKSDEWIARAWNGGPSWQRKPAPVLARTAAYWLRVKSAMRNVRQVTH